MRIPLTQSAGATRPARRDAPDVLHDCATTRALCFLFLPTSAETIGMSQDFKWIEENDPVMGGVSTNCTFSKGIVGDSGVGVFEGVVQDVPSLKAPGFCFARTFSFSWQFPDVSAYSNYVIEYKSDIAYSGFKAAFVSDTIDAQFGAFKADFNVSVTEGFETVSIPFSSFSNKWSGATGEPTSHNPPTTKNLHDISQLQIWAEGTKGPFNLAIRSIGVA